MWPFKKKIEPCEPILVKTIKVGAVSLFYGEKQQGFVYFYLYEDDFQNRTIEHKTGLTSSSDFSGLPEYSEKIYPWLKGEDFKDIPTYWEKLAEKNEKNERYIASLYKRILKYGTLYTKNV